MTESIAFIRRCVDAWCFSTVRLGIVVDEDAENDDECHLESDEERNMPSVQHEMLRAHDAAFCLQPSARRLLPIGATMRPSYLPSVPYILSA